jgi:hypothetical protein
LVATEIRLHRRHGITAAVTVTTGLWMILLAAIPDATASGLTPWVLFLDLAALGFFFVPALMVVERSNGVTAALALTRVAPARALLVRVGAMAVVAVGAAVAVVAVAHPPRPGSVLLGAGLTSVFLSLLAVAMLGRATTLTTYFSRVPLVAVPMMVPAMADGLGVVSWWGTRLSPATSALRLLAGSGSAADVAWLMVVCLGLGVVAARIGFTIDSGRPPAPRRAPTVHRRVGPWLAFARLDRRALVSDPLLPMVVAGVPILALGVRWLAGPGTRWMVDRYGLDPTPYLPLAWAFVLVVHTPVVLGSVAGLLFLEDRDAGVLPAIATTPASVGALLRYRVTTTAAATLILVGVGVPLAEGDHEAGPVGIALTAVAAGALATVPLLLIAGFARDRAMGISLMKVMSLPFYLPLIGFFDVPGRWAMAVIPSTWPARALWATTAAGAAAWAVTGLVATSALGVALGRRVLRSVVA